MSDRAADEVARLRRTILWLIAVAIFVVFAGSVYNGEVERRCDGKGSGWETTGSLVKSCVENYDDLFVP